MRLTSLLLLTVLHPSAFLFSQTSDMVIYDDALQPPWINSSWSATVDFESTTPAANGTSAIKVALRSAWGALSLHHGTWGSAGVDPMLYQSLDFAVHGGTSGTVVSIFFENDAGQSFPAIGSGPIPADQWTILSVPMERLNPNNQTINRISIQDLSGSARTFYVDDLQLVSVRSGTPVTPPLLVSPPNGATDLAADVTFSWHTPNGMRLHRLQVSTDSSFSTPTWDQDGIQDSVAVVSGLESSTVYSWRVNATEDGITSEWSEIWSFTTASPPAQGGWATQSSGTNAVLSDVAFVTTDLGTIVGQGGTVLRTTNAGATWLSQSSNTSVGLNSVSFADAQVGAAVGYDGMILRTSNGGDTWFTQSSGTTVPLWEIELTDSMTGYAVGGPTLGSSGSSVLLTTSDGGTTWNRAQISSPPLFALDFVNRNTGWAVGRFGTILKTTDAGATWISQGTTQFYLVGVSFVDEMNGWAMHSQGLLRTTNGGGTWTSQSLGDGNDLHDLWFTDVSTGIVVGSNGMILRTTDGGLTWRNRSAGVNNILLAVMFSDALTGTVVGGGGMILRTTTGGGPAAPSAPILASPQNGAIGVETDVSLSWNPSSGAATYHLQLSRNAAFDPMMIDESGMTSTSFDVNGLTNGVEYYWRVRSADTAEVSSWSEIWSFIAKPVPSQPGWESQASGTSATLSDSYFINNDTGTVVGNHGTILRTTDAGATWTSQASGTTTGLNGISFANADLGVAVGYNGLILRTTNGGETWTPQNSGTTESLWAVELTDATHGYIVGGPSDGFSSVLLLTTDGGATWVRSSIASYPLFDLDFLNTNEGWVVGRYGTILKTTNGGASWISHNSPTGFYLVEVSFVDPLNGWAMHSEGVLRTTNGGASWTSQLIGVEGYLADIHFADPLTGTLVGTNGTILTTTDGGSTWMRRSLGVPNLFQGIEMLDVDIGVIVGEGGTLLRSTRGEQSLVVYDDLLQSPWINASWGANIAFQDTSQVWAGSRSIRVAANRWGALSLHHGNWGTPGIDPAKYESFDFAVHGGATGVRLSIYFQNDRREPFPSVLVEVPANTWSEVSLPMNQLNPNDRSVNRFAMQNYTGLARTFFMDNVRFVEKPVTSASVAENSGKSHPLPSEFGLSQNYPNPFNPTTTITFQLPRDSWVSLKVYDILGREVAALVDGHRPAGYHSVQLNGERLSSGVYLYRIDAYDEAGNRYVRNFRMILMK